MRLVYDNNYFNDTYQGIPIGGYNKLVEGLLDGMEAMTGVDFFKMNSRRTPEGEWLFDIPSKTVSEGNATAKARKIVFTGQIDEYFGFRLGHLNFRTVRFETEVIDKPNYQGNAVVNYTDREVPYTRVIEHKHFEMFGKAVYECPKTVVSREYSTEWKPGMEPYYPVNDERNNALANDYRALAAKEQNVIFGGRLAEYKYYDMAPVIESAIRAFHAE